jgi:hypothetical protein
MSAAEARQRTFTRAPAPTVSVRPVSTAMQMSSMRVSQRNDLAEREAESTAKKIMRMEAPPHMARFADSARLIARSGPPAPNSVPGGVGAEINAARGGGSPMPIGLRRFMQSRFQADFSRVRIHTGDTAAKLNRSVSAHAFTVGNDIFFGKDKYQPETTEGKELLAHELTHTIQQGGATQEARRSEDTRVGERSSPYVARLGLSDALDYFARQANNIPGFRMFTIILGMNPINSSRVDRSAANILRAVVEFIPGGGLIVQALDNYGVFERAGRWIDQQLAGLGITGASIRAAINRFLDSLSWRDILDLGGVWNRAVGILSAPIERILRLLRSAGGEIVRMIKDAILQPLAQLASRTRGWDLLCAVLGRNPITGEAVPRNAETLIGGFMRLIGQEEIWQNIQRSGAISRAWAWFQGALSGLMGFVGRLPEMFMQALRELEIADIVLLPRAFLRVGRVFASFAGEFFTWAGNAVWNLLEIIFAVVAPGAIPYLQRARSAFRNILRDPVGFVGTLVRAAVQGFRQFGRNFLTHLRTALVGWLTGALSGANIYIPQAFNLREIVKFVLSVLGLTWQNIRQKLVRAIGETAVTALETTFDIVRTLVTEGPAAAWEKIVEQLTNLRDLVIEQVMTFVRDRIIVAAVTRLVSMLNPAGAFVQAIIAIYNTIMFFVERMRQLITFVQSAIDAIYPLSIGDVTRAANAMEQGLVQGLTLVISFLARLVGLGRVSDAVTNVINRVRQPIDRALDRVVEWIVTQARRLGRLVVRTAGRLFQWWRTSTPFTDESGQRHTVRFRGEERNATLIVESTPMPILDFLLRVHRAMARNSELQRYRPFYDTAMYMLNEINAAVVQLRDSPRENAPLIQQRHAALQRKIDLLIARPLRVLAAIDPDRAAAATTEALTEYNVQRVHALVVAEARNTNANVLRGHGRYTPGFVGHTWNVPTHDQVDAIGYADGDHSDTSIRDPGTSAAPANTMAGTVSRRLSRAHWIPDHQPPNEIADAGRLTVRFYPHSLRSARRQGGAVRAYMAAMTRRLNQPLSVWSRLVRAAWFW